MSYDDNGEGGAGEMSSDSLGGDGFDSGGAGLGDEGFDFGGAAPGGGVKPSAPGVYDARSEDALLSVPAFANAANRALNEQLIERTRKLARASAQLAEHQERGSNMASHRENITKALQSAQKVAESKARELKTEEHLGALAERATGRARQDLGALDGREEVSNAALASVQMQISKGTEQLENFKTLMHWKQGELEKWAGVAKQKEEDRLALEQYTRGDEQRIKDLLRENERLTGLAATLRKQLSTDATETSAKQVELDKTAEEFRGLHKERQELIVRWQESLAATTARDAEIAQASSRFASIKAVTEAKKEQIAEAQTRLDTLLRENMEMDARQTVVNRNVGDANESLLKHTKRVDKSREDVELLKNEVLAASADLASSRAANQQWIREIEERRRQLAAAKLAVDDIKARRSSALASSSTVEEAVNKTETFLKREAVRVERLDKEVAGLREAGIKARGTIVKLREEEDVTQQGIMSANRAEKTLRESLAELDVAAAQQAKLAYNADFEIAQMERKLARIKGEVSDEERIKLEARIKELRTELDDSCALNKQLSSQVASVKTDLNKCTYERDALGKRLTDLTGKIDNSLIGVSASEEALRRRTSEKEEAQVNHDVLRLGVKRLRDALSTKSDEVFSLENRTAQLKLTIEVRKREIESSRTLARAEAKLAEEERHRLALDFADRSQKIVVLKVKFESLCARLRGSPDAEGNSGEPISQAFFILQAAQKRELLQREGDEVATRVTSCEKELKALAATLAYVNARNDTFREAFHAADPGSNEAGAVRALETQVREAADSIAKRRRDAASMRSAIDEGQRRSVILSSRIEELARHVESLEVELAVASDEANGAAAAERATMARLRDARARHRSATGAFDGPTPDELAFAGQAARETAAGILFTLGQLAAQVPSLEQTFSSQLQKRGLRVPARAPGRPVVTMGGLNSAALALAVAEPNTSARSSSSNLVSPHETTAASATPMEGESRRAHTPIENESWARAPSPMVLTRRRDMDNAITSAGGVMGVPAARGSVRLTRPPLKAPIKALFTPRGVETKPAGLTLGVAGTSLRR